MTRWFCVVELKRQSARDKPDQRPTPPLSLAVPPAQHGTTAHPCDETPDRVTHQLDCAMHFGSLARRGQRGRMPFTYSLGILLCAEGRT